MTFKETIARDIKEALRGKDALRLSVLRMLAAAIHNREIEKRAQTTGVSEEEMFAVLRSEAKKRRDAIGEFRRGGRNDLVLKESAELKILEAYMSPEMDDVEIAKIVDLVIQELGVVTEKDFGKVMGVVMKRIQGSASGEKVGAAVKRRLQI